MPNRTVKLSGIVIREIKTKESDRIITVLTKEMGVVSIYAKAAMRLRNKFNTRTNLFTYSEFVAFESRSSELMTLNEATVIHRFHEISDKIEYLALAMYMSELVREVSVPDDVTEEILRLFLNMLHMMVSGKWSVPLCKAAFEMRLLSEAGFRPDLLACSTCGAYEADRFYFHLTDGNIICSDCAPNGREGRMAADMPVIMAMRYLAYRDLEKMFSFSLSDGYVDQLSKICRAYVSVHTNTEFKTLDFYNSVMK
jgi:DNA repair protein RecO (recombination protein O)